MMSPTNMKWALIAAVAVIAYLVYQNNTLKTQLEA